MQVRVRGQFGTACGIFWAGSAGSEPFSGQDDKIDVLSHCDDGVFVLSDPERGCAGGSALAQGGLLTLSPPTQRLRHTGGGGLHRAGAVPQFHPGHTSLCLRQVPAQEPADPL